jgi:DNA-binding NarL/FixJ family response regulator
MSDTRIAVGLIEDEEEVRAACAAALRASGIEVQAYASCRAATLAAEQGRLAPIVLIDLELPGESSLEAMRSLRVHVPELVLIAFTGHSGDEWLFSALVAGCVGYVLKHDASLSIVQAVRRAAAGDAPMTPGIARRVLTRFHAPVETAPTLSEREQNVLAELAEGYSYEQAALRLGISLSTVRTHVQRTYAKLGVRTKSEATLRALRLGLLG